MISMKKTRELHTRKSVYTGKDSLSFAITSGEKCKVVGLQDGTFVDFGHHLPDEMGGVWMHPTKIADAFWLEVDGNCLYANAYETLPYATKYFYDMDDLHIERIQYAPDDLRALVIEFTFHNLSGAVREIDLRFIVRFDILPVWYSGECGIQDGEDDAYALSSGDVIAKDALHEWYGALTCEADLLRQTVEVSKAHLGPYATVGKGVSAAYGAHISLSSGEKFTARYALVASDTGETGILNTIHTLWNQRQSLWEQKQARYQKIANAARLVTSDKDFDQVFEWVKYNTDWLMADCGEYGRGLTAGNPEYPWWFGCDNAYAIQGLLAMGAFEDAKHTLELLEKYSRAVNGNGRIVHEITTIGEVPNCGNSQETGHFITAVKNYWKWTGDTQTVMKLYPYCAMGVDWLLGEMDPDGDLLPSGYGIIEIEGLNVELIDTAVYTCQALYDMAEMACALGYDAEAYMEKAGRLKQTINTWLWNEEEGLFVDAVGTPRQIAERIAMLEAKETLDGHYREYLAELKARLKDLPADQEFPFIINKNWVIDVPMETCIADPDKARRALETMDSDAFVGPYGTYLAGFMHAHTMTISTGVHAVANGRNGRCDRALELLNKMCGTFSLVMPGSICEMSPDYGCTTQAWTAYAMMVPVVECFAGFMPEAQYGRLTLKPNVPAAWTEMTLENVRVQDARVDFRFVRHEHSEKYAITVHGDLQVEFERPPHAHNVLVNGCAREGRILIGSGTTHIGVDI